MAHRHRARRAEDAPATWSVSSRSSPDDALIKLEGRFGISARLASVRLVFDRTRSGVVVLDDLGLEE